MHIPKWGLRRTWATHVSSSSQTLSWSDWRMERKSWSIRPMRLLPLKTWSQEKLLSYPTTVTQHHLPPPSTTFISAAAHRHHHHHTSTTSTTSTITTINASTSYNHQYPLHPLLTTTHCVYNLFHYQHQHLHLLQPPLPTTSTSHHHLPLHLQHIYNLYHHQCLHILQPLLPTATTTSTCHHHHPLFSPTTTATHYHHHPLWSHTQIPNYYPILILKSGRTTRAMEKLSLVLTVAQKRERDFISSFIQMFSWLQGLKQSHLQFR